MRREPADSAEAPPPTVTFSTVAEVRAAAGRMLPGDAPIVAQSLLAHQVGPSDFLVSFRRTRISYSEIAAHCGRDLPDGEADLWISQTLNRALRGSNARYVGPHRQDRAWALIREFRFLADPDHARLVTPDADIEQPRTRPGTTLKGEAKASHDAWRQERRERYGAPPGVPSYEAREAAARLNTDAIAVWETRAASGEVSPADADDWIGRIFENAVRSRVCLAVRLHDNAADARAYLESHDVPAHLDRLVGLYAGARMGVFSGLDPALVYGAVLVDRVGAIPAILAHTSSQDTHDRISRFWQDHHRALGCLANGIIYEPDLPDEMAKKLRLIALQLELVSAVTKGTDLTEALAAEREAFDLANEKTRASSPTWVMHTVNPTKSDPVRFDLAAWAILRLGGTSTRDD